MSEGNLESRLLVDLNEAEAKAWDSLARYKFQMFGYWAAIWVHLNRVGQFKRSNPWSNLVKIAKARPEDSQARLWTCAICGHGYDAPETATVCIDGHFMDHTQFCKCGDPDADCGLHIGGVQCGHYENLSSNEPCNVEGECAIYIGKSGPATAQ